MLKIKKNVTLNGQSLVQEGENQIMVARMSATLNSDGVLSFNKSIDRPDLYKEHKAAVQKDMADFDAVAYELESVENKTE